MKDLSPVPLAETKERTLLFAEQTGQTQLYGLQAHSAASLPDAMRWGQQGLAPAPLWAPMPGPCGKYWGPDVPMLGAHTSLLPRLLWAVPRQKSAWEAVTAGPTGPALHPRTKGGIEQSTWVGTESADCSDGAFPALKKEGVSAVGEVSAQPFLVPVCLTFF